MLNRIKAVTKTRFKRTNFNAFLFFLFFAVFIWIIVQFSKEYNEIIEIPVEYINVPPDKIITGDNPEVLNLQMEGSGFEIASRSLFTPVLKIDLSKAREEDGEFRYVIDENRNEIESQLEINFDKSGFLNEVISVSYQQKKEKRLPLESQIEVEFAAGYAAAEELQLEMDSITVSGPRELLDTLDGLKTVPLVLNQVKEDLSGKVAVDTSDLSQVTIYKKEVGYSLDVEKYTEGRLKVPVELINVPEGMNVVIFPKEILLFFQVNLKDFNKVGVSDFRVVCDFEALEEGQNFLVPVVKERPNLVTNVRLNENKISFVIKK